MAVLPVINRFLFRLLKTSSKIWWPFFSLNVAAVIIDSIIFPDLFGVLFTLNDQKLHLHITQAFLKLFPQF